MNARKTYIALCVWAVVFMAAGCASQRVVTDLDSAGYRVSNGYKFLDRGMVEEAEREFKAASDMERHFSPAFAGLAIARAEQGHFDLAAHLIQQATTYAQDPTTQAEVEVANIRILTIEKQKDWIERAMTSFNRATALNPRSMAPYFFLGRAFKESYNFKNAEEMFLKAAGPPNPYQARARSEAALVAAVIGYAPQSMAAKKAVLEGRVNRAELAAILTQEFDVARFAPPRDKDDDALSPARDIADHPYRKNIETVRALDLPVLRTEADGLFHPYEPVKRAELAAVTQEIIIRATGRSELDTLYVGRYSPFSDLRSNSPYFNAAMLNVSLGIMDTRARDKREFDPLGPVSGADTLRILHRMMDQIEQIKAEKLRNT